MTFAKPYAEWRGMFVRQHDAAAEEHDRHARGVQQGSAQRARAVRGAVHHVQSRPHCAANHVDPQPEMVGHSPAAGHHHVSSCSTTPRESPRCRTTPSTPPGWLTLDELTIARSTNGVSIRRAPGISWYHFTFNGAPGSILADKALRLAIAKGIDRQTIADVTQRGLGRQTGAAEQPHLRRRPEGLPGQQRRRRL